MGPVPADSCQARHTFVTIAWQGQANSSRQMQPCCKGSLPGWKPCSSAPKDEGHMLMLIPITAESNAEDGIRFLFPSGYMNT